MNKQKITFIVIAIVIYLVSTGVSYAVFSRFGGKSVQKYVPPSVGQKKSDGTIGFDQSLPKTQPCPLNGALYSEPQKTWWESHRPLGVMIENHEESRPQSGLSSADVVYEAVAEGGITRFLAVYYCQDAGQIGPVRSARKYFIDFFL